MALLEGSEGKIQTKMRCHGGVVHSGSVQGLGYRLFSAITLYLALETMPTNLSLGFAFVVPVGNGSG